MTPHEAVGRGSDLTPRIAAAAVDADRSGVFPAANIDLLRDAGLLALTCPLEWGGEGLGVSTACRVVESIAKAEPSTALILAMQYIHHGGPAQHRLWRADGHERMAREAAEKGALLNVMRVEPELGTPARGGLPTTTATQVEGGWVLHGHKMYATGSPVLSYFVTWARTAEDPARVGWFALPRESSGWRIERTWDHLGMRATGSDDLILEGAFVPAGLALDVRPPAAWLPPDPYTGVWNNLVLGALYRGIALAARDWLVGYLHERKPSNLGAALATVPRIQTAVGKVEALLWAGGQAVYSVAESAERGVTPRHGLESSMAKHLATNNAVRAVERMMDLVGNPGLSRHNPLERHHRDVLCGRIHVPQDDMTMLMAGKAALGVT